MDSNILVSCVNRLHRLQAIYLTFYPQTGHIPVLRELITLRQNVPGIRMQNGDQMNLQAVLQSGKWERISRTVPVYGLAHAHKGALEKIAVSLESVSAGDHVAKALFTSNKHKQLAAATTIINAVLDGAMLREVADWGLTASAKLVEIDSLPAIRFCVMKNNTLPVVRVSIDGFTGRFQTKEGWSDTRCSAPEDIQKVIREGLNSYLEKATVGVAA